MSWSPVRLRHVRTGMNRRRSLTNSLPGRLTSEPSTIAHLTLLLLYYCRHGICGIPTLMIRAFNVYLSILLFYHLVIIFPHLKNHMIFYVKLYQLNAAPSRKTLTSRSSMELSPHTNEHVEFSPYLLSTLTVKQTTVGLIIMCSHPSPRLPIASHCLI